MRDSSARRRRCLALGLLAVLLTIPAHAQTKPFAATAAGQSPAAGADSSLMAVHDGRGTVTIIAEQASVREVFRILSRWFDFPTLRIDTLPDVRVPVRFERMPIAQAVQRLLRLAGLPAAPVTPRPRPAAARRSPLVVVHDGRGAVTVMGEQASTREVMALLSRWFGFPVMNPEVIPDARGTMRFDGVPVAQLVDHLLRSVRVNYVILTNPQTAIPSKVVAAPLSAAVATPPAVPTAPANEVSPVTTPGWPGSANIVYPPVTSGAMMPMPVQVPVDPAMPMLPIDPVTAMQPGQPPSPGFGVPPANPPVPPAPAQPGAARPGVVAPPATPTPSKPPG